MENHDLSKQFLELSTPLIADACVRHNCATRIAPPGIRPLLPGTLLAGRVLPAGITRFVAHDDLDAVRDRRVLGRSGSRRGLHVRRRRIA